MTIEEYEEQWIAAVESGQSSISREEMIRRYHAEYGDVDNYNYREA